jgi:hypothetical protein
MRNLKKKRPVHVVQVLNLHQLRMSVKKNPKCRKEISCSAFLPRHPTCTFPSCTLCCNWNALGASILHPFALTIRSRAGMVGLTNTEFYLFISASSERNHETQFPQFIGGSSSQPDVRVLLLLSVACPVGPIARARRVLVTRTQSRIKRRAPVPDDKEPGRFFICRRTNGSHINPVRRSRAGPIA